MSDQMGKGDDELLFTEDDELLFQEDNEEVAEEPEIQHLPPWKILIVDDDKEVHMLTQMVLSGFTYENRNIEIFDAYSGKEAVEILKKECDIALVLLDVVMESDNAGLLCAEKIRHELNNESVRIILRTGQPGQAPEQDVIINYDINDYKAKTELTAQKLFTTVTAALRAYRYIKTINQNRLGLEKIISASESMFEIKSLTLFAEGVLQQLTSILRLDSSSFYLNTSSFSAFQNKKQQKYYIIAATGEFSGMENIPVEEALPLDLYELIMNADKKHHSLFTETTYTGYFETSKGEKHLIFLKWQRALTEVERNIISRFASNVAISFKNICHYNEIVSSQKEIITALSELASDGSELFINHIHRVTATALMLADKLNLSREQKEMLELAAPMYDVGKSSIPWGIIKKRGPLTTNEREIVEEHPFKGFKHLNQSDSDIMHTGAIIARQHHEKWDGSGYPQGIKGEEINIFARIMAVADVADALISQRPHKKPWPFEEVFTYIKEQRGLHFDPSVVDAFLSSKEEYQNILNQYQGYLNGSG